MYRTPLYLRRSQIRSLHSDFSDHVKSRSCNLLYQFFCDQRLQHYRKLHWNYWIHDHNQRYHLEKCLHFLSHFFFFVFRKLQFGTWRFLLYFHLWIRNFHHHWSHHHWSHHHWSKYHWSHNHRSKYYRSHHWNIHHKQCFPNFRPRCCYSSFHLCSTRTVLVRDTSIIISNKHFRGKNFVVTLNTNPFFVDKKIQWRNFLKECHSPNGCQSKIWKRYWSAIINPSLRKKDFVSTFSSYFASFYCTPLRHETFWQFFSL